MTLALGALHFIRPFFLLGLLPLYTVIFYLRHTLIKSNPWQAVCDTHLLPYLIQNDRGTRYAALIVLTLIASISIFALSGPAWSKATLPLNHFLPGRVIVLDLSSAMSGNDIHPTRYERAKFKIIDLLKRPYAGQTGFIVFSANAFVVSPLTLDSETIVAQLPELNPAMLPKQGCNVNAALHKAALLLQQANLKSGQIILLSTGAWINDSVDKAKVLQSVQQLRTMGYVLSVLGVGLPDAKLDNNDTLNSDKNLQQLPPSLDDVALPSSDPIDVASLQQLAQIGGGQYATFSNDDSDLDILQSRVANVAVTQAVMKHVDAMASSTGDLQLTTPLSTSIKNSESPLEWQDQGHYFILLLLVGVLMGFRRGWLERWS